MNRPLTKQQKTVYDFIREKIVSRGYGPTVREIGEHMNIKSPNGVMCHLRALERKGMIVRRANKSRAIELTEPISRLVGSSVPLLGSARSEGCTLTEEASGHLDFSRLAEEENFALRIGDDSLQDMQIRSGDLLILRRTPIARHGQLTLVRLATLETHLRIWQTDGVRIRLQPANRSLPPNIVEHAEVVGIVIGVIRDLSSDSANSLV